MEILKKDVSKMVTIAEYAKRNCVSRQTVYNWIADGRIKKTLIGGIWFIEVK